MVFEQYILSQELIFFTVDVWFVLIFLVFFLFSVVVSSFKQVLEYYFKGLFQFILFMWIMINFTSIFYFLDFSYDVNLGSLLSWNLSYNIFNVLVKFTILVTALLFVPTYEKDLNKFELYVLYGLIILGLVILSLSANFLVFYLGLELQSLAIYLLIAYRRKSTLALEASLKYYILGALASGILLLGISILYGYCGTINFYELNLMLNFLNVGLFKTFESNNILLLSGVLVTAAFIFKLSAAPFHSWAPDVYQASTMEVVGLVSVVSKIAIFFTFVRILLMVFSVLYFYLSYFLMAVGLLSIFIGNFAGLFQTDLRRLLAYSTISHIGFLILGLSTSTTGGLVSSVFYMIVYSLTNTGLLLVLRNIKNSNGLHIVEIRDLISLNTCNSVYSYMLGFLFLSLAGLPPLGGFFAKYYVILQVIDVWGWKMAYPVIFISILGSFFYLYIVYLLFFVAYLKPTLISHVSQYTKDTVLDTMSLHRGYNTWLYFDSVDSISTFQSFILSFFVFVALFLVFFVQDIFSFIKWFLILSGFKL